jgi:predicted dehydrogenase
VTRGAPVIKVGVVGVGSMGRTHVAAFSAHPGAEVTAVCDPDEGRLDAVAREFDVAHRTTDVEELVSGDVDAVVVATPEHFHLAPALAALGAGKHLLLEKPLATTVEDAHAIADVAAGVDAVVLPGLNLRYEPRYRQVKDWLASGDQGAIVSMYLRRNRPAPLFEHYSRIHPAFETGSHDVDLALWYSGRRVTKVFAVQRGRESDPNPFGLWALAELDGGTVVTLETVWLTPGAARVFRSDALELVAERGTAHVDIAASGTRFWDAAGSETRDPILDPSSLNTVSLAIRAEVEDFVACVRGDRLAPEASLADAVHGVEIVDAMIRSAELGAPVDLAL